MEELRFRACERGGGFMAQMLFVAAPTAIAEDDEGEEESDDGAGCCCSNAYTGCGFGGELMRAVVVLTEEGRSCRRNYTCGWSSG